MSRHRSSAFTVVELMVVIALVMVILSLMLVGLSWARESARRAQCLSNLKQLGMVYELYAAEHRGRAPLGWRDGLWAGYFVSRGEGAGIVMPTMGQLYLAGLIDDPKALYCPSQPDPRFQFNTDRNPWPPPIESANSHSGRPLVRAGYTTRPVVRWSGSAPDNNNWPRWAHQGDKAVISEVIGIPNTSTGQAYPQTIHGQGVNLLYGDRSAYWMPSDSLQDYLDEIDASSSSPPARLYLDASDPDHPQGLWAEFDKRW